MPPDTARPADPKAIPPRELAVDDVLDELEPPFPVEGDSMPLSRNESTVLNTRNLWLTSYVLIS